MRAWLGGRRHGRMFMALGAIAALMALLPAAAASVTDPREGLSAGWLDAGQTQQGISLLSHNDKPTGFVNPASIGNLNFANSDIAFSGNYAFAGNFAGFQIYDISNPAAPTLKTTVICPGGQGDVSVYGNLLFMSVEETRAQDRLHATPAATAATASAASASSTSATSTTRCSSRRVQTCRGSHTHTLVTEPERHRQDLRLRLRHRRHPRAAPSWPAATATARSTDPTTANFRIDVIEVPLAAPQTAAIVSNPRIFSKCGSSACEGDYATQEQHPIRATASAAR